MPIAAWLRGRRPEVPSVIFWIITAAAYLVPVWGPDWTRPAIFVTSLPIGVLAVYLAYHTVKDHWADDKFTVVTTASPGVLTGLMCLVTIAVLFNGVLWELPGG